MDISAVTRLIAEKAQESLYLEFKSGKALTRQNDSKKELVKDVTGFANADGGRIVYGIEEKKENGITIAGSLSPLTSIEIDKDWVASVVRDNTSPRFHDFDVSEFSIEGGRMLVIDVRAGRTAHQNLMDMRYYQRAGTTTSAITDFQIRDLMARSAKPEAEVGAIIRRLQITQDFHRYLFGVSVRNIGNVTMEKWWLEISLPAKVLTDTRSTHFNSMMYHKLFGQMARKSRTPDGMDTYRISFGDHFFDGSRHILHPQQKLDFIARPLEIPEFIIEIDHERYGQIADKALPWTLYLNNSPPITGEIPFSDWCDF